MQWQSLHSKGFYPSYTLKFEHFKLHSYQSNKCDGKYAQTEQTCEQKYWYHIEAVHEEKKSFLMQMWYFKFNNSI